MAISVNHTTTKLTIPNSGASATDYAGYVFVPMFFIMGVVGNSLTIRIMLTKGFRTMPVSKVLIALSVSDTIVNLMLPFNKSFVRRMLGVDVRSLSSGGCKVFYWTYRLFKFSTSWMIVLISTERFVAVWLHVRAKSINTTRNAYIAMAVVYGFFAVYIGYWSHIGDNIIDGRCIPNSGPPEMAHILRGLLIFGSVMYVTLPSILLIVLNTLIVYKLVLLKKKKNTNIMPTTGNGNTNTNTPNAHVRSSRTNAMLICVAITFIVLETPIGILHSVSFVKNQSLFETRDSLMVIMREISQVLEQLNHSINFLLYVLASKRFRDRVVSLFSRDKSTIANDTSVQGNSLVHTTPHNN